MWHWTIINFWAGINTIENEIPIIGCDLLFSYNVGLKSNIVKMWNNKSFRVKKTLIKDIIM